MIKIQELKEQVCSYESISILRGTKMKFNVSLYFRCLAISSISASLIKGNIFLILIGIIILWIFCWERKK